MNIKIDKSFERDIRKIKNKATRIKVAIVIENIRVANSITEIPNLKKITGFTNYYRIRLGEFRFGVIIQRKTFKFIRFLHRKDIYRYFP